MSCSIQFVRRDDYINDVDVLDFSTAGYSLAQDGYFQVSAPDGVTSVHEVITLKLQGTSKDDLAAMTQEIDEKIRQIGWWLKSPGVERYQVWLRVQLENESLPRQAQILSILPPDKVRTFTPEERIDNYLGAYSLAFERTPFWEDANPSYTEQTMNGLSSIGGVGTLSGAVDGDVAARMVNANAICANTGTKLLTEFWFGIKTDRFGTPGNFDPLWELNDAGWTETDTTSTSDTEASSGTALLCDFTLVTLQPPPQARVIMTLGDAIADQAKHADQRGTYQVLLRARLSNNVDTILVRMEYGYAVVAGSEINAPMITSRVPINLDDYRLYDLGVVRIPPNRVFDNLSFANFAIQIDCERDTGLTANLYLDCLILIPIDDAFIKADSGKQYVTDAVDMQIYQAADDSLTGQVTSGNAIYGPVVFTGNSKQNWSMPISGVAGRLIVATQGDANDKDDAINVGLTYIKRWRTLRGNVT